MTGEEIKKLYALRHEIEAEMREAMFEHGANSVTYDVLMGQMELMDGIFSVLNITTEDIQNAM